MKKKFWIPIGLTLIVVCFSVWAFTTSKDEAASAWANVSGVASEKAVDTLTTTVEADGPLVEGCYADSDWWVGYARREVYPGEIIRFNMFVQDPIGGDVTYEWGFYKNGQLVTVLSFESTHDPGYQWWAYYSVEIPPALGNYQWGVRFTDGQGNQSTFPVTLPLDIVAP
jgi:hypothetical protein